MCLGVFVQINEKSPFAASHPIGYVIQENGCWDWVGPSGSRGYGQWWLNKRYRPAHRVMYERANGPIPLGLVLDHLCRDHSCVNPDHLEAVTQRENVLRGNGVAAANSKKTHCPKGHEYTPENTYIQKCKKNDGRICRMCQRAMGAEYTRRYRARQMAKGVCRVRKGT